MAASTEAVLQDIARKAAKRRVARVAADEADEAYRAAVIEAMRTREASAIHIAAAAELSRSAVYKMVGRHEPPVNLYKPVVIDL